MPILNQVEVLSEHGKVLYHCDPDDAVKLLRDRRARPIHKPGAMAIELIEFKIKACQTPVGGMQPSLSPTGLYLERMATRYRKYEPRACLCDAPCRCPREIEQDFAVDLATIGQIQERSLRALTSVQG